MRDYIVKKYSLSIDFLDYSKNNQKVHIPFQESYLPFDMLNTNKDIVYSEKDTNTAFIEAQLLADGTVIDLSGYDKVAVGIKKNDGLRVHNDCNVLDASRGRIEIPFTSQSLASVGINYFDITLYKGKSELVSPRFSYRVMESMVDDSSLESSNEFGTLVLLIEKTDELLKRTNSTCDRVDVLEELVLKNESKRNENEELRKSNEISRNETEIERQTSESTRNSNESQRVQSEIERVNFYNDASTKENQRIKNEETRVFEEDKRIQFENDRKSSEISRKNNEQDRVSSEIIRESHEDTRILSEITRVSNEEIRVEEFNGIKNEFNDLKNNTEVIQARTDEKNVTYENLKMRLDSMNNSNSSEPLLNENVTSFKVATGTVNGVNKDYTNEMEQSLVTLDNIEGKSDIVTSNDGIKKFKNLSMKNIFTLNEENILNYFESATMGSGNATGTKNGINIHVTISNSSWGSRLWTVTGLTPGKVYCISTEVLLNSGGSALDVSGAKKIDRSFIKHSDHMDNSSQNNILVLALSESLNIHFYCTLTKQENGDVHYNNVNIREVKDYSYVDLELKAIRNDIKDTFSNGIITQKISSITVNGTLGYGSDLGSFSNVYRCFVNVEQFLSPSDIVNTYFFESTYLMYSYDYNLDSEHYYLSENGNQVCLFIAKDKVDNLFGDTISDKIITYLKNNPLYINYVHSGIIEKSINASILLNKNDVLYTDSNRGINFTHTVQLNTKSQIEELQKSFISEKKSMWSKIKDLIDVKMHLDTNGYIKLPTLFSGLIIQWGIIENGNLPGDISYTTSVFPISFSGFPATIQLTTDASQGADNRIFTTSNITPSNFRINTQPGEYVKHHFTTVRWLAIGK